MLFQKYLGDILKLKHMKARKERVWLNATSDIANLVSICFPNFTSVIEVKGIATYTRIHLHLNNFTILPSLWKLSKWKITCLILWGVGVKGVSAFRSTVVEFAIADPSLPFDWLLLWGVYDKNQYFWQAV